MYSNTIIIIVFVVITIIVVITILVVITIVITILVVIIIAITKDGLLFVRTNALKHAPCWVGRPLLRKNAPEN